jgi:hypothetical protein
MQVPANECAPVPSNEALDLAALRPGDIILSRPRGLESSLIALFGQSNFSHAQLLVTDRCLGQNYERSEISSPSRTKGDYDLVIEATTDFEPETKRIVGGVGYRRLAVRYVRQPGSSPFKSRSISPISDYLYFDVFRHQSDGTEVFRTFIEEQLPKLCQRYANEPYATLHDLAQASAMPQTVEALGEVIKIIPRSPRPGLFCSQLVATIFAEGGFPLTSILPRLTRPQDLALADTLVRKTPQTRVVIEKNAVVRTWSELAKEMMPNLGDGVPDFDNVLGSLGVEDDDMGRLIFWGARDAGDRARDHCAQMERIIASVQGLADIIRAQQAGQDDRPDGGSRPDRSE